MKNKKNNQDSPKELALYYMKMLVEVSREAFLILDPDLQVITGNSVFYRTFQVKPIQTEKRLLRDLGNGQWNIPELNRLLEEILPKKKFVKDYKVSHVFETIGKKVMQLNASQIDSAQLIILAMEDITEKTGLEEKLSEYTRGLEVKVAERTRELERRVNELERMNKIMVGREMKMIELKAKLNQLKK